MKFKLYITLLLVGLLVKAQQEELISNTWYLQKVTIDATDYFPPSNSEITVITAIFADDFFSTEVCNAFWGVPTYNNTEQSFSLSEAGNGLGECWLDVNRNFEDIYLDDFFYDSNGLIPPLNYTIEDMGTYLLLTLTNSEDDQAFYTSDNLSTKDLEKNNVKIDIYPNPVKDHIFINTEGNTTNLTLKLFDLKGRQVLNKVILENKTKLNISSLVNSIYLLAISDENDKVLINTKIVKE